MVAQGLVHVLEGSVYALKDFVKVLEDLVEVGLGICGGGFVSGGFCGIGGSWSCACSTGTTITCGSNR